jgi:hypothetical protein
MDRPKDRLLCGSLGGQHSASANAAAHAMFPYQYDKLDTWQDNPEAQKDFANLAKGYLVQDEGVPTVDHIKNFKKTRKPYLEAKAEAPSENNAQLKNFLDNSFDTLDNFLWGVTITDSFGLLCVTFSMVSSGVTKVLKTRFLRSVINQV